MNTTPAMKVFVYGHYDSRGGTVAALADTREEADALYIEQVWGDDPELEDAAQGDADESFLGEAVIEGDLPFVPGTTRTDHDLEAYGRVLAEVNDAPGPLDEDLEDDPPVFGDEPIRLMYVPADTPAPPGWYHPRWDDDAFGFLLVAEGAL